jgi:peroxiredoxin
MKKIIAILLLAAAVGAVSFFAVRAKSLQQSRQKSYGHLPAFCLPDIEGKTISNADLQENKTALFLFFEPGCHLCHEEMEQISSMKDDFSGCQMVFFSLLPPQNIANFLEETGFSASSEMFFLADENAELYSKLDVRSSPTACIYGKNGDLLKRFDGPVKAETLLKYLSPQ